MMQKEIIEGTITKVHTMDTSTEELIKLLNTFPSNIKSLQTQRIETDFELLNLERSKKRLESETIFAISEESVDGKPIFSNEQKRKAELIQRLSVDDTAINLQNNIDETKQAQKMLDIELEYERNRFRAVRKVVDLVTSE